MADSLVGLGSHEKAIQILENFMKSTKLNEEISNKFKEKLMEVNKLKSVVEENLGKLQLFKDMKNKEKLDLYELLTNRGIKLKPQFHNIPQNYEGKIYLDTNNDLHFPFLIIYEEFNITDYIKVRIFT